MYKKYLKFLFILCLTLVLSVSCKKKERRVQTPPVVDAGGNQDVFLGNTAVLDASKSIDKDGDKLSYLWDITSAPEGSNASIDGRKDVKASLKSNVPGTYEILLTVSDGELKSSQSIKVGFFIKTEWTMFGGSPKHTGLSESFGPINGKLDWQIKSDGTFGSLVVTADSIIYVGNTNRTFYAIKDGNILWEFKTNKGINSSPAIDKDGNIYFGSADDSLYALDSDGKLKWIFRTQGDIDSPCIIKDDTIYFGSGDSFLYALNMDGTLKWKFKTGYGIYSSPAIGDDGTVYVGSADYTFYAITKEGKFLWNFVTDAEILASAAIDDKGNIYFGSLDSFFYALDKMGNRIWTHKTNGPIYSTPAIDGNRIYFGSHDTYIYSLGLDDGGEKWRVKTGSKVSSPAIVDKNGTVYIGSNDTKLYAINRNGQVLWHYETTRIINYAPVIGPKGYLYVVSWDRTLSALKDI